MQAVEILIRAVAAGLPALATSFFWGKYQNAEIEDIADQVFLDLGDFVEIRKPRGPKLFGKSKPGKVRKRVLKKDVVLIQHSAVVSLFFKNKGVIDIFVGGSPNSQVIADRAVELFPSAELVRIE